MTATNESARAVEVVSPTSEVHLVESANQWTLTLTMTDSMLNALRSPQDSTNPVNGAASAVVVVHIEPNLVPGEPFEATVAINALPD